MKNRASLTLMELLVMVLVFAVAAAVCLRLFAAAGKISGDTVRQDRAVILAQNAAEALKAGREPEMTDDSGLYLHLQEMEPETAGMKQVKILVLYEAELVFAITTGWQEVGG